MLGGPLFFLRAPRHVSFGLLLASSRFVTFFYADFLLSWALLQIPLCGFPYLQVLRRVVLAAGYFRQFAGGRSGEEGI